MLPFGGSTLRLTNPYTRRSGGLHPCV